MPYFIMGFCTSASRFSINMSRYLIWLFWNYRYGVDQILRICNWMTALMMVNGIEVAVVQLGKRGGIPPIPSLNIRIQMLLFICV